MNGTKSAKTNLKVVTSPSSELAALVDDYVLDQRTRNLSPATIKITKDTLHGQFLPWAAQRKVTAAAELTQGLLDAWQRYLLEEHRTPKGTVLSKESVRSYQRSLRGFVRWATERGDVSGIKVTIPKAPTKMVDVLSREEMLDMEKAATGERDKIIIKLLADTGIRLGELVALRPADLMKTKDGRYIRVKGKGDRERDVPIADPRLFERMLQYSKRPQVKQASSGRLFLTDRKHQGGYSALSGR